MFYIEKTYSPQEQADIIAEIIEGLGFYIKDHQPEAVALLEKYSITTDGSGKQMADAYVEKLFDNDKKFTGELISELAKYDLLDMEMFHDKNWSSFNWMALIPAATEVVGGVFGAIKSGKDANVAKDEMKTRLLEMLYGSKESEKKEQNKTNQLVTISAVIVIIIFFLLLIYLLFIKKTKNV